MNGNNNGREQRKQEWQFRLFIGFLIIAAIVSFYFGYNEALRYIGGHVEKLRFELPQGFFLKTALSAIATFALIITIRFIIWAMRRDTKNTGGDSGSPTWQKVKSISFGNIVMYTVGIVAIAWLGLLAFNQYREFKERPVQSHGVIYRQAYTFVRTKPPWVEGVADTPQVEKLPAEMLYYAPNTRMEFDIHYRDEGKAYTAKCVWDIAHEQYGICSQPSPEASGRFFLREKSPGVFVGNAYYKDETSVTMELFPED